MVSKKCLRMKCTECKRLLPSDSFHHTATILHSVDRLICVSCRHHCVQCGQLLPRSAFPQQEHEDDVVRMRGSSSGSPSPPTQNSNPNNNSNEGGGSFCVHCVAKRQAAVTNVYFRYPVLKYRACPFSVDKYRDEVQRESWEATRNRGGNSRTSSSSSRVSSTSSSSSHHRRSPNPRGTASQH